METPFFTPQRQYKEIKPEIKKAIENVLNHGSYILGPEIKEFEKNLAQYLNMKNAVAVASGSDALFLGLKAMGIKPNDEVITSPFTFFSTVSSITRIGAKPVFVDIDPDTFNIDVKKIENKITKKTKAILPIHLFLQPAKMDEIVKIADKYDLKILEDAAEAFGMKYKKRFAGSIGDIGIFSFYPTKTLGTYGDGGAVVSNNQSYIDEVISLRNHGQSNRYHHREVGYNDRLDTIQGAILNVKLNHIDDGIKKRNSIGKQYNRELANISEIQTPHVIDNVEEVYYVYSILTERRDELKKYLEKNGIGTNIYYPIPLHLQECFKFLNHKKGEFPVAEKTSKRILALPMFPELKEEEIKYITKKIKSFFS